MEGSRATRPWRPVRLGADWQRPSVEEGVPRSSALRGRLAIDRVSGAKGDRGADEPLIAVYAMTPSPGQGRQVTGGRDTLSLARPVHADRSERLGATGAQRVAETLSMDGCEITSVDLSGNEIGAEGVRFLASALREIERKLAARTASAAPSPEESGELSATDIVALVKAKKAGGASKDTTRPEPEPEPEPEPQPQPQPQPQPEPQPEPGPGPGPEPKSSTRHALTIAVDGGGESVSTTTRPRGALFRRAVHRVTMITALSAPTPRLTTLDLARNSIGALGLRLLVDGLFNNESLTTLVLAMNKLGSAGAFSRAGVPRVFPSRSD